VGKCPTCSIILAGRAEQLTFENYQGEDQDTFGDVVRIYPEPPKVFTSYRIPRPLSQSLTEADRSLQAGANIAACVMLGRALEALCRDVLEKADQGADQPEQKRKRVMLNAGIKELRERKVIDDRLYDWSQNGHELAGACCRRRTDLYARHGAQARCLGWRRPGMLEHP
jgi:Domain of unknown function (DUF4145)